MSSDFGRAARAGVVGRDVQVQRIAALLSGEAEPADSAVLLVGSRGMGRTAVLNAAAELAEVSCIRFRGTPDEPVPSYGSLLLGLSAAATDPTRFPVALDLLTVVRDGATQRGGATTPQQVAERMLSTIRQSATAPVRLLVDDVHRCDGPSQHVLTHLAHHGYAAGVRAVLSADDSADLARFGALPWLRLGPLDLDALTDLVARTTHLTPPHRVRELLHLWTGGNPALLIDLVGQLSAAELKGAAPIGIPLTPSAGLLTRHGLALSALTGPGRRLLASFALAETLPLDVLRSLLDEGAPSGVLDGLLSAGWLDARQCSVTPSRRLDALATWNELSPADQQELSGRLGELLRGTQPMVADYLDALAGDPAAAARLPGQLTALVRAGDHRLASAACALVLQRTTPLTVRSEIDLVQHLVTDGYTEAARRALVRLAARADAPRVPLLDLVAQLAAMSSDPADALAHVDAAHPPTVEVDTWATAALTLCRVQLALDGPAESSRLLDSVQPVLPQVTRRTRTLAALVGAECDVYRETPGSPAALGAVLDDWLLQHDGQVDLPVMSAVLDLLGLGRVSDARDLLGLLGSPRQPPFATSRSALLILRTEAEIAAGHYRRAAASLLENDRQRPSPSGADLMIVSQAIRIGTVCDDLVRCQEIEARLGQPTEAVLPYPSRRSHTAAQGYRELAHRNYGRSRVLLGLALEGPALLLQGRTCILADLVEATVADGDRPAAEDLLGQHRGWLPDAHGERAAGLLARCEALVAVPDLVDARFRAALAAHPGTHEADRARTLVAYGRTLIGLGRHNDARSPLSTAIELLRESRMPGWERHAQTLLAQTTGSRPTTTRPGLALTEFEQRVLDLVLERRRNRDIAASLFVSLRTVESHLTRIFRKLGVSTKAQLFRQLSDVDQPLQDAVRVTAVAPAPGPAQLTRNPAHMSANGVRAGKERRR